MSGLRGDISKLRRLEASLRELPRVVAQKVATASAGVITSLAEGTFNAGENAFGDPWEPGAEGQRITLRRTGALAAGVKYVAIGTRLRAVLGPKYAKFATGKHNRYIFPRVGSSLPASYVAALRAKANEVIRAELGSV